MKNLILYTSKHGCAEKCANMIKKALNEETTLVNLKKGTAPSVEEFDNIILGGSIYVGKTQPELKKYVQKNAAQILSKKFALFLCSADSKEDHFAANFPKELYNKAITKQYLGSAINIEKLGFFEKIATKMVGVKESYNKINQQAIEELVKIISL